MDALTSWNSGRSVELRCSRHGSDSSVAFLYDAVKVESRTAWWRQVYAQVVGGLILAVVVSVGAWSLRPLVGGGTKPEAEPSRGAEHANATSTTSASTAVATSVVPTTTSTTLVSTVSSTAGVTTTTGSGTVADTPLGTVLAVGDVWRSGTKEIVLSGGVPKDYSGFGTAVDFSLTFRNRGSSPITFSYFPSDAVTATDNLDSRLKVVENHQGFTGSLCHVGVFPSSIE